MIRHGDLCFVEIKELPKGLKEATTKVIMTGSGGNDHWFDKGKLYFKNVDQFVFGYFVSESGTKVFHKEHGKPCQKANLREITLPKKIWELRKQQEETHEGMKPVVD